MTATLDPPRSNRRPASGPAGPARFRTWLRRPRWWRFTPLQLLVLTLATIPPLVIAATVGSALVGLVPVETMLAVALAAGENPGMLTFAAMFLASPVQWWTGRSQVRVRKYLGIVFYLLAVSNGAMFVLERGIGSALGAPFLVAGTAALALATPLALTSSRWSQRAMGLRRWRRLHRLTYLVAGALVGHVVLLGDPDPGALLIATGFVARIPVVRRWIGRRGRTPDPRTGPTGS